VFNCPAHYGRHNPLRIPYFPKVPKEVRIPCQIPAPRVELSRQELGGAVVPNVRTYLSNTKDIHRRIICALHLASSTQAASNWPSAPRLCFPEHRAQTFTGTVAKIQGWRHIRSLLTVWVSSNRIWVIDVPNAEQLGQKVVMCSSG